MEDVQKIGILIATLFIGSGVFMIRKLAGPIRWLGLILILFGLATFDMLFP